MSKYPKTSSETLLKLRKFNIERRQYNVPDYGPVQRELVVHPGAVLILPLLDTHSVVMIRNYRFAVETELLELPAGTLEPPESPQDCALRELQEETGYKAGHIEHLHNFYTSPGFTNELMHVYVATDLEKTAQKLEGSEQIRVAEMSMTDALAACWDGRIMDGKTIAALTLYHLGRKGSP
jgi:ADP-ribose pyrophosphatase